MVDTGDCAATHRHLFYWRRYHRRYSRHSDPGEHTLVAYKFYAAYMPGYLIRVPMNRQLGNDKAPKGLVLLDLCGGPCGGRRLCDEP